MFRQRISSIKFFINKRFDETTVIEGAKIISLRTMILVTGGTGLIGSQLVFDLISKGQKVRVLKRKTSSLHNLERLFGPSLFTAGIEFVDGDLTDGFSLEDALIDVDTVYHTAAFISFHKDDREMMMKVNVDGTASLVNLSLKHGVRRFCHISSVAAIGREKGASSINEKSEWKNSTEDSNYALSKFRGEREVWRAMEEGAVNKDVLIQATVAAGAGDGQMLARRTHDFARLAVRPRPGQRRVFVAETADGYQRLRGLGKFLLCAPARPDLPENHSHHRGGHCHQTDERAKSSFVLREHHPLMFCRVTTPVNRRGSEPCPLRDSWAMW